MAKSKFEMAWSKHHRERLTKKQALIILENEMNIKNKCFDFLIHKDLYDEYHSYICGRHIQTNDKSALAFEAIGLITGYLNLEEARNILIMLVTYYFTYEEGLSTEHKEDVSFNIRILNEAIGKLMKAS